ncbi:hypothetical protein BCR32DRAFT_297239 [Anaeromyces robustus]|uniref:Secreted protein n=1 Tax=Anaeromyces robustus TaxID=1754192 RepID=A0A1Y1WGL6_9FUNG|nr:hypothetical protein BCR32DRAFT_297239 [Anaeromyces robustus]|eukprot:ORX72535.1 hypothetical protein BCR32DRAFT_297239 [Anaeromyces robustus]
MLLFWFFNISFNSLVVTSDNSTKRLVLVIELNCSYKKEWECLFKYQAESIVNIQNHHSYNIYCSINLKTNLPRNVSADKHSKTAYRVNADPIYDQVE